MDAIEHYARTWAKKEEVEVDALSEWLKSIRTLVKRRLYILSKTMSTKTRSVFTDHEVIKTLNSLHDKYVVVPADKAANNVIFVCKSYYYQCLVKELGIGENIRSSYEHTTLPKEDILRNHKSVINSFGINVNDSNFDLPFMYWIPKLHKCPYKQRYIAGSSKCSTKPLSQYLTHILTTIKDGMQRYCENTYSRSGVNQMWILKNS